MKTWMNNALLVKEGARILTKSISKKVFGRKQYDGDHVEICESIIQECYNSEEEYFMVSPGHFNQFYMRDFAWVCDPLLTLGYEEKVRSTLQYALQIYQNHDTITTQISPGGRPVDFPYYTPESLAYLVHCLKSLDDNALIEQYQGFLRKKANKVVTQDIDGSLLRTDRYYSSMKDHSKRKSSCYNNCMVAMLKQDLKALGIKTKLDDVDVKDAIRREFWNGEYFHEDLSLTEHVTGDANIFPFWTGVFTDKDMFEDALDTVTDALLNEPIPLKYSHDHPQKFHIADWFAPGYERDTCWAHLGICYLNILDMFDHDLFDVEMKKYREAIEKHKNFLEVYTPYGEPFKAPFYECEGSMIWAAGYLSLVKKHE